MMIIAEFFVYFLVDKTSREFKYLQGYFNHSKADGVTAMAEIEEIYRIRRAGEFERFEADGFDADGMMMMKKKKGVSKVGDGRKLLWHGSRGCNYSGILSQGLRIGMLAYAHCILFGV